MVDSSIGNLAKWSFAALTACITLVGCGRSGPKTIPVSGHVTYQGAPVSSGMIMFRPASGLECRPGRAFLRSDGTYEATTIKKGDGLMAGEYRVSILPAPVASEVAQKKSLGGKGGDQARPTGYPNFPSRYRDPATSGLTLTVDADAGHVTFDVPLEDK